MQFSTLETSPRSHTPYLYELRYVIEIAMHSLFIKEKKSRSYGFYKDQMHTLLLLLLLSILQ